MLCPVLAVVPIVAKVMPGKITLKGGALRHRAATRAQ